MTDEPHRRVRLVVAYDGSEFSGFARNPGVATVAGTLEAHLARVLGAEVTITGAGRTDKGVHAWGQVVTFDLPTDVAADEAALAGLCRSVNKLCGGPVVIRHASIVAPDVDARFSATWRQYRYRVNTAPAPDPFLRRLAWWVDDPLDLDALRAGATPLVGEHDFSSLCRRPKVGPDDPPPSLVRRVIAADWRVLGPDLLELEITGTAFCHQMVRSIVGLLVDVGRGRRRAVDVVAVLAARDRAAASPIAPPHGLCLWAVGYPGWRSDDPDGSGTAGRLAHLPPFAPGR